MEGRDASNGGARAAAAAGSAERSVMVRLEKTVAGATSLRRLYVSRPTHPPTASPPPAATALRWS